MKGKEEMSWILMIGLIVLVVVVLVNMDADWTDFLP